jgi:hypothetical protein
MPRLKPEDTDFDLEELEEAEYSKGTYTSYDGEVPPNGTIIGGKVKKMWWTRTQNDEPMLKLLFEADDSDEEYEGLPVWEYMALTVPAKFKWQPFIDHFGITLREVKTKVDVEDDDDPRMGAPIIKIGTWEVDSDDSFARVVIKRERYNGQWQARIGEWLPYDADEPDDEPEDEPEERPARGRRTPARTEAKPPARGARPARSVPSRGKPARPAPARGKRGSRGAPVGDEEPPF